MLFGFKWQSGHFEHGGIEIGADHHFVAAGARGNFSRPLDHERFTNSSFVGETFEVTKSSGGIVSIAAVVSSEDDDGVVGDAELFKFGNNAAYAVVESLDHACTFWIEVFVLFVVERFGFRCVFFHQCGWCHVGAVQGVVGKVEQEGFVFFLVQELESRIGEFVGEEVAFFAVIQTGHAEGGEVFSGAFGLCPFATADVDVEAVAGGVMLVEVGLVDGHEVPFSEKGSGVVGGFERFRKEDALVINLGFPLRNVENRIVAIVPCDPVGEMKSRRVTATENGGAAGRANRAGGVAIGEAHAVFGELVDLGCLVECGTVTAEIPPTQVIDEEENEVGFFLGKQ